MNHEPKIKQNDQKLNIKWQHDIDQHCPSLFEIIETARNCYYVHDALVLQQDYKPNESLSEHMAYAHRDINKFIQTANSRTSVRNGLWMNYCHYGTRLFRT